MRRLARHAFTILSVLSLLLCMAACVLWVRSRHGGESIERVDANRRVVVTSKDGVISAARWDGVFVAPVGQLWMESPPPPEAWQRWKHWRGVSGVTNEIIPFGFAYPPLLGDDHWWQTLGFDAWDRQLVPMSNAFAVNDWLQPTWTGRLRGLTIPYWAVALLCLAMPAAKTFRAARASLRVRGGCCPTCGYDLRASPDRCPECGAANPRAV